MKISLVKISIAGIFNQGITLTLFLIPFKVREKERKGAKAASGRNGVKRPG